MFANRYRSSRLFTFGPLSTAGFRWILAITVLIAIAPLCIQAAAPITFDDFFSLGRVSDPQVSPDGKSVAFVVTFYSKEENKGNSDIYLANLESGSVRKLTSSPKSDSQPRFSPDGRYIAFTSSRSGDSQIWLLPLYGGEARQITELSTGGSSPAWTPDSRSIIFTSDVFPDCPDDSCNAKKLEGKESSKVKARIIDDLFYRHWDHWRGDRRSHVFIVPVDGGTPRDLTLGPFDVPTPALGSRHDCAVHPKGTEICVVANTDPNLAWSTNNDLFIISLETKDGSTFPKIAKRITTNPANDNHPVYSPNGRYIAYRAMARPGFEADQYRLMLYDRKDERYIDAGRELAETLDRSVASIAWSPDGKRIYVTAGDKGFQSVYEVDARKFKTKQLSEKLSISSLRLTPNGKMMVFLRENATMPHEVFTSDTKFKKLKNLSRINETALAALDMNPLEEFTFPGADDTPVHGFLLKPPGFEKGKRYPMIFLIHGGPQGAWEDEFHWRWNYQMFAAPGYVVVAINFHGSTGYGQAFTDAISRDWGGKCYEDLMKGLDFVLEEYSDIIDSDRIAAAGASFGGYMINWIEGHNTRFKCLINHDGVYNLTSMYGSTEELWFPEWDLGGTPWDNPEGYKERSPHTYAKNFKTPMLIIHGENDFRVPVAEAFQAFTALKRQGVPARFLYFPDENHFVTKPQNAELWWKTMHKWFVEWLD